MSADVTTVCVVIETNRKTGHSTIYGVFDDERVARTNYGDEEGNYSVGFHVCTVFDGRLPIGS